MMKSAKQTHESRQSLWDESIALHRKYLDPQTQRFATDYTEERPCPVCEKSEHKAMFTKEGGDYVKCATCEMVYLNPALKDRFLTEFYQSNHSVQAETVEADLKFYRSIYQSGLDLAETVRPAPKNAILDYGCSSGLFLDLSRENGWQKTYGIELNRLEAQLAKQSGHDIQETMIDGAQFSEKLDMITLWDVFEHIKDGAGYLAQFKDRLAEDGVILIQVPNAMSLAARLMKEESNMFDGLEHVNLYSPSTITRLANRVGFEVRAIQTVISELAVLNNYINYEDGYSGAKPGTSEILPGIDEKYIHDNLLGYKIQAVLGIAR